MNNPLRCVVSVYFIVITLVFPLVVLASAAYADNNLGIFAGRDVNLIPGREQSSSSYSKKKESIGIKTSFSLDNISTFAGYSSVEQGVTRTGDYTAGSYTGAGNDVFISAGRDLNQVGSHIEAGRDVNIEAGQDWNMTASFDRETLHQYVKTVEAGITASARQNVTSAAQSLIDLPQNATAGKGNAGYKGLTAASAGLKAVDSVKGAVSSPLSASATLGGSYSKTNYNASSSTAQPSTVSAGRDVDVTAERDINIEGGRIFGGRDVILDAGRDLNIFAAQNNNQSAFSSESGGGGVGVKAVVGPNGLAAGINFNAQAAGSNSQDKGLTHNNALIVAGDTLYTSSGRDTTIAGAHLEGDKVWMDVGRDLTVASLQDSYDSKSSSWNAGVDVTVGYGLNVSGNAGMGKGKTESDWVGQQTSIVGKSEVDIYTEGNTHLKGAIIATNPGGDLTLNTGTLTLEEIQDKDKGYNWGFGISGGFSMGGVGFDKPSQNAGFWDVKPIDNTSGNKSPYIPDSVDITYASHDKQGVLRPTVTEGEIIVRNDPDADLNGLNRDLDRARETTKDEENYVNVYVSPGAIQEVVDGFGGITGMLATYGAELKYSSEKDKLAADQELTAKQKEMAEALLRKGATVEEIKDILNAPLSNGSTLGQALSVLDAIQNGQKMIHILGNPLQSDPANGLFVPQDPLQLTLAILGEVSKTINTFTPEQQQLALFSLDMALGGPVKALLNQAKDKILEVAGVTGAVGEFIHSGAEWLTAQIYGEAYTKDWQSDDTLYGLLDVDQRKAFLTSGAELGLSVIIGGVASKVGDKLLWSSTGKKNSINNAEDHWSKHGNEFPNINNVNDYISAAKNFTQSPPSGTLINIRPNGDTVFYNPSTNTFAVTNSKGLPKTMFKPDPNIHGYPTNMDYFNAQ